MPPDRKNGTSAPMPAADVAQQPTAARRPTDARERQQRRRRVGAAAAEPRLQRESLSRSGSTVSRRLARAAERRPQRRGRPPDEVRRRRAARRACGTSARTAPAAAMQSERVVQRDRLEDGPQLVIAVGARAEHAQIEVDLRVRPDAHAGALDSGCRALAGQADPPLAAARASSAWRPPARRRERPRVERLVDVDLRQPDRQVGHRRGFAGPPLGAARSRMVAGRPA